MFVHILSMFPEHSSESSQAVNRSVTWLRDGDKWLGWAVNTAQKEPWLLRGGDIQAEPQKGGEKGSLQKESWGGAREEQVQRTQGGTVPGGMEAQGKLAGAARRECGGEGMQEMKAGS